MSVVAGRSLHLFSSTDPLSYERNEMNDGTKTCASHEILGVSKSATIDEIKKAFREKALQLHPDAQNSKLKTEDFTKTGANPTTTTNAAFMELRHAYEQLLGESSDKKESEKVASYGPGMRARMAAAKNIREKHGQNKGTMRAAREWSEQEEEERQGNSSNENGASAREAHHRQEQNETAAEILFRARQKRRVENTRTSSFANTNTNNMLRGMKMDTVSVNKNGGNTRIKVLAAIAVAGAIILAANRKSKRREKEEGP